ncbi:cystatin-2-like [Rana temporaria]|uniref:cystatin-2-like n=1 Tax=Rana temporaria TaxID=8407 RepID=UPI001AADE9CE|nr:cystatin-2-like [Rana temporaria]XP_040206936.1 cystatin-2-like [Rana temporaria]
MAMTFYISLITALCFLSVIDTTMTGGWTRRESDDPKIVEIAKYAVKEYNKQSNDIYAFTLSNVKAAESQVVAGANYKVTVEIGETDCRKNYSENEDTQACNPNEPKGNKILKCEFTIFDQPWNNIRELTKSSCS